MTLCATDQWRRQQYKPRLCGEIALFTVDQWRDRQLSDITTARAKVKPKGDRMKIHEGA